jgi:hypothetical protein
MAISINYQKRKNATLFTKFQTNKNLNLTNVQNYIPIYDRFFSLNDKNYNSVNLNHFWAMSDIINAVQDSDNSFMCKLKNLSDDDTFNVTQKVFIKLAPLLDPCKYLVGKYNYSDPELFNLPTFNKNAKIHPKLIDTNNLSYVDGFFSFLTSKLLHEHQFIHGIDYYGSFLAIKNDHKINIIDDIDYLIHSDFFNKQQNILFKVDDYSHLISKNIDVPLPSLIISNSIKNISNKSFDSIDDSIFENIFEERLITLDAIQDMKIDLIDITNSNEFYINTQKRTESLNSGSTCSSRTSHTNDDDLNSEDTDNCIACPIESDAELDGPVGDVSLLTNEDTKDEDWESCDSENEEEEEEEEEIWATFPKFPVQVICTEHCEDTFDNLIMSKKLTTDEWFSALMQIIMILITYQKLFAFTHNDLHTSNIMYISTNKKFLYYTYKDKTYKVPTFGKIFKIIDFGRAIYKFNGKTFCSDSFQTSGDAATQYNTEPYFNNKKPRLDPNFSFDLCRLACSIFDYVVNEFESIKHNLNEREPIVKLIVDWCIDDNGINMLYKNNGVERYPDFKLYKMIARCVHKHTPHAQLLRPEFSKFVVSHKNVLKGEFIFNIDTLPCYI